MSTHPFQRNIQSETLPKQSNNFSIFFFSHSKWIRFIFKSLWWYFPRWFHFNILVYFSGWTCVFFGSKHSMSTSLNPEAFMNVRILSFHKSSTSEKWPFMWNHILFTVNFQQRFAEKNSSISGVPFWVKKSNEWKSWWIESFGLIWITNENHDWKEHKMSFGEFS